MTTGLPEKLPGAGGTAQAPASSRFAGRSLATSLAPWSRKVISRSPTVREPDPGTGVGNRRWRPDGPYGAGVSAVAVTKLRWRCRAAAGFALSRRKPGTSRSFTEATVSSLRYSRNRVGVLGKSGTVSSLSLAMKEECLRFHLVTVLLPETRAFHRHHVTSASYAGAVASPKPRDQYGRRCCGQLTGWPPAAWLAALRRSSASRPSWWPLPGRAGCGQRGQQIGAGGGARFGAGRTAGPGRLPAAFYHAERSLARALLRLLAARPDRLPSSGFWRCDRAASRRSTPPARRVPGRRDTAQRLQSGTEHRAPDGARNQPAFPALTWPYSTLIT